jgi:hypothetical protein
MDWMKETEDILARGLAWLMGNGAVASFFEGETIKFTTADGQEIEGTVNSDGTVTTADG